MLLCVLDEVRAMVAVRRLFLLGQLRRTWIVLLFEADASLSVLDAFVYVVKVKSLHSLHPADASVLRYA